MNEREIFLEALEKAPADRAAWLKAACGVDADMQRRIEALLKSHDDAGSFMETPVLEAGRTEEIAGEPPGQDSGDERLGPTVVEPATGEFGSITGGGLAGGEISLDFLEPIDDADRTTPGAAPTASPAHSEARLLGRLGPYLITEVIGRGGMGVVLKGQDPKLNRVVAIKVLAPELASNATARKRFLREAQAAAAVSHDHVVTIHAIDESGNLPYIVMEYVDGWSLQERIDQKGPLEVKEILRIARQTALGLAAAHEQGLIHRDIKPANILLENGVERVKITDFGLARAVDDVGTTQTGVVAGTPQYMSPEQAQGQHVDHRSDLFSLGCVMYAMCTGRSPFRADSTIAVIRRVCDDTPRPIPQVNSEIPDWLVTIIDRLLVKRADDRFQSAREVAELLGTYLAHLQHPTQVPPPEGGDATIEYVGRSGTTSARKRFASRFRWAVAAAVIFLLVLFGGLSFTEATGRTQIASTVIRIVIGEGTLVLEVDDPNVSVQIDGEELIIAGAGVRELRVRPGEYRIQALKNGKPVQQQLVTITRGGRRLVKIDLLPPAQAGPSVDQSGSAAKSTGSVPQIALAKRLFIGELTRWNWGLSISPDGQRALTGGPQQPGYLCLWDVNTGREIRRFNGHNNTVYSVAISPDGRFGLSGSDAGSIRLWDLETGKEVRQFKGHTGRVYVAFSPDGRLVLSGSADYAANRDNTLRLWDAQTGRELRRLAGNTGFVTDAAFSPDGKSVAAVDNGRIILWNVETGEPFHRFAFQGSLVGSIAFSPDGRFLVSGHNASKKKDGKWYDPENCVLRLWDVQSGRAVRTFRGHSGAIADVAFSPDGRYLLSASSGFHDQTGTFFKAEDHSIRLWEVASGREVARYLPQERPLRIAFTPNGHEFLSTGGASVRLWDVPPSITATPQPLTEVRRLKGHQERVYFVGHSADGRYVYSVSRDRTLRLWDAATGRQLKQFNAKVPLRAADMSRDGRILVAGGHDGSVTVWSVESGAVIRELRDHKSGVYAVALSDDATLLAAATSIGSMKLWDLPTGKVVWEARGVGPGSYAVGFSPDGRHVMLCTRHAIEILDRKSGKLESELRSGGEGLDAGFRSAAYSPDGRWVAVGCFRDEQGGVPSRVGLWDGKAKQPVRWLGAHTDAAVTGLSFSPDGGYLLSGGIDRTLRLWEIESGQQLAAVEADTQCLQFVSWLLDGKYVLTGGGERWEVGQYAWVGDGDYALRLWRLPKSAWPQGSTAAGWIELLSLVDPKQDSVKGDWTGDRDELVVAAAKNQHSVVEIPYQPPAEYDLLVEFTRLSGTLDISLNLSRGEEAFGFNFAQSNRNFGISRINGGNQWANRPDLELVNGRRYVGKVEVRENRVTGYLDEEKIFSVDTTGSKLTRFPGVKQRNELLLGLTVYSVAARFHRVAVREVTGRGNFPRGRPQSVRLKGAASAPEANNKQPAADSVPVEAPMPLAPGLSPARTESNDEDAAEAELESE